MKALLGWCRTDANVAATKNLAWYIPNSVLYNLTFTGWAKVIPRCQHCLTHLTTVPIASPPSQICKGNKDTNRTVICQSMGHPEFNQVWCRSQRCKYQHLCNLCSLPHPAQVCPMHGRGQWDRSHPSSPCQGQEILKVPMA